MKNIKIDFNYSLSGVTKYLEAFKSKHWLTRDIHAASIRGETALSVELEDLKELIEKSEEVEDLEKRIEAYERESDDSKSLKLIQYINELDDYFTIVDSSLKVISKKVTLKEKDLLIGMVLNGALDNKHDITAIIEDERKRDLK